MDQFLKTLKIDLSEEETINIAKEMVTETQSMSKKPLDLTKFDWSRVQYSDLRDERTTKGPCQGHHSVEKFGRGSLSGSNGHGIWLCCSRCRLRVLYAPTWGAKATYRQSGPLDKDVKKKLQQHPENDVMPHQLETYTLGLDAAEASALKKVEAIRKQKAEKGKAKGKGITTTAATSPQPTPSKKDQKRDHAVPAEVQEVEEKKNIAGQEWIEVDS